MLRLRKGDKIPKKKVQLFIVLFISFCSNYTLLQRLPLTRALKGFFLQVQTCVLVDVNQPLPWFFTCWPRADSFPVSRALGRTCPRLSRFCNILLQDPAQLHVKIMRSTNLLSVCRRKLKLSPYTHCKLQPHKLSQCTFPTRQSSCPFWILFDNNEEWQVDLQVTKFIFENSLYSEETFPLVGVMSFVSLNLYSILCNLSSTAPVHVFIQSNK